jgi:hypothetical protein
MAAIVAVQSASSTPLIAAATDSCHVTIPNGSTPPAERPNPHHHGNGRLWTGLPLRGEALFTGGLFIPGKYFPNGRPGFHRDGSATDKFYWWGARSASRRLRVMGQRLDGPARPLSAYVDQGVHTQAPHFWPSYLTFPTSGCWRITARAGRAKLTFQVSVSIPAPVHG